MSLAQASLDFYRVKGTWPLRPSDLVPTFMYAVPVSPFKADYFIQGISHGVTVSTQVPSGLAQNYNQGTLLIVAKANPNDTVSITQELPNEWSGRMEYEKKYSY